MKYNVGVGVLLLLFSAGCSLSEDIHISSLMQAHRSHEVIQELEAKLTAGQHVSSFHLFFLCEAYLDVRRYDKVLGAADLLERSIAAGDTGYYGTSLRVYPWLLRAQVYVDYGDYPKAIQAASQAYAILQQEPPLNSFHKSQTIDIMGTRGLAYALSGQKAQAQADLAVVSSLDIGQTNLGPEKHIALARIHMANHNFRDALAEMNRGESQAPALLTAFYDQTFQTLPRDFIISKSLYETGQLDRARQGYDRLLAYPYVAQVGSIYWAALLDRARIARAEKHPDEAIQLLSKAMDIIEQQRASINTEAGRIGFVGDKQDVYQEMVCLLVEGNRAGEAFECVERAKARALVDLLASQKDLAWQDSQMPQVRSTLKKLGEAELELAAIPPPQQASSGTSQRGVVVGLKEDLAAQAPELASLVTVTGTSIIAVQQLLAADEDLIEYYLSRDRLYAFVVNHEGIVATSVPATDLQDKVRRFREALTNPGSTDYLASGQALYQRLLGPLSGSIRHTKLIIVPHGVLHYVPFAALYDGEGYVIDRHGIRMVPSASVLRFLQKAKGAGKDRLLAVGNPDVGDPKLDLRNAEEEARSIAKTTPSATVLLRSDATKSYVKANADRYRVLHFATHGLFDPANPLGSSLLLARDKDDDGRLTVAELYHLRLDADLVTLSACDTALGKVAGGDDVVGFTRGWLFAGASSIVSSLWKVDDLATRDLMIDFYANLASMDKSEALRRAQQAVRKTHEHLCLPKTPSTFRDKDLH